MGYNAGGTYFENHRSSGYDTVANDVSCVVELTRSKRQAGGMMPTTDSIDIGINAILMQKVVACREQQILDARLIPINAFSNPVLPCPTFVSQVRNDPRFVKDEQFRNTATSICYLQRYPVSGHTAFESVEIIYGQQCCYNGAG